MNRALRLAIGGVALIGITWYGLGFERVPVTERTGLRGEARLRPFLAAERFSEKMGLAARELRALPALDRLPTGAVLLLPRERRSIDERRAQLLELWVRRGGHLVLETSRGRGEDVALARFGLRFDGEVPGRSPERYEVTGRRDKMSVSTLRSGRIVVAEGTPTFRVGAPGAERILSLPWGKGRVTAAVELDFARNHLIGRRDHAELFWRLMNLAPSWELVVFHHPQRLSLWDFLLEHAAAALAAAALLLALWLWRIAPRIGTLLPDPPPVRRRLLDHLRASGRYLWSRGLGATLGAAAREAALRRVARAYPEFATASAEGRAARLGALAGLSTEDAAHLLAPEGAGAASGAELIRLVHCAQRVHAALERGKP